MVSGVSAEVVVVVLVELHLINHNLQNTFWVMESGLSIIIISWRQLGHFSNFPNTQFTPRVITPEEQQQQPHGGCVGTGRRIHLSRISPMGPPRGGARGAPNIFHIFPKSIDIINTDWEGSVPGQAGRVARDPENHFQVEILRVTG